MNKPIIIEAVVKVEPENVWEFWNGPEHIVHWMHASEDWECPQATNDLKVGGHFSFTFAAKDKSVSFDFSGTYDAVVPNKLIEYTIEGGRKVKIEFEQIAEGTFITETFDPEDENSEEIQRTGWQAILNNFKKYAEEQKI